jgi:transcriptional regulator with XRE-family HTH domain
MKEAMVAENIRGYIKEYMANTGTVQSFIAKRLGYDPKVFSQLINGRRVLHIADLIRICDYFGEPVSRFIRPSGCKDDSEQSRTA